MKNYYFDDLVRREEVSDLIGQKYKKELDKIERSLKRKFKEIMPDKKFNIRVKLDVTVEEKLK